MRHALPVLTALCGLASAQSEKRPLDRTGVDWTLPFTRAQALAKERQRLIFVPVIAGGTDRSGCW